MKDNYRILLTWLIGFTLVLMYANPAYSQEDDSYYKMNLWADIPITLAAGGGTAMGFSLIDKQDKVDSTTIFSLDKNDVNGFDRFATEYYNEEAEKLSDPLFLGAFPYGFVLLFDKEVRKEAPAIGLMYLKTMALSSMGYSLAAGLSNRYRPYAYNPNAPFGDRTSLHARNSFYGGHPATVAASTVFVAKVYNDLNPDSKFKYVLWGVAGGASLGCAYLRLQAGKHFPTDLITGLAISSAIGYFVPHFHKRKKEDSNMSIVPFTGNASGVAMTYKF